MTKNEGGKNFLRLGELLLISATFQVSTNSMTKFLQTEREQKTKEKGSKKPYLKIKFNQLITDFKMHKFKTGHLQTRTKNPISLV